MSNYIKKAFGLSLMSLLAVPEMEAHAQEVVQSVDQSVPETPVEEAAAPVLDYSVIEEAEQALAAELPAEPVVEEAPVVVEEEVVEEAIQEEVAGPEEEVISIDEEVSNIIESNDALVEESDKDSNVTSEPVDEETDPQVDEVVIRDISIDTQSNQTNAPPQGKTLEQVRLEVADTFGVAPEDVELQEVNGEFVIMNSNTLMTYANLTDAVTGGVLGFDTSNGSAKFNANSGGTTYGYYPLYINGNDGQRYAVFCIEPWQEPLQGYSYTGTEVSDMTGNHWMANDGFGPGRFSLTPDQLSHMGRIIEYGYNQQPSFNNWYYTQAMLWEYIDSVSATMNFGGLYFARGVPQSGFAPFKSSVTTKLNQTPVQQVLRPSFNGQSITNLTYAGQSITLTDTNNVLQHLNIPSSSQGYSFSVSGNRLTITRMTNNGGTFAFNFAAKPGSIVPAGSRAVVFANPNSQDVMFGGEESPGRTYTGALRITSDEYNPTGGIIIRKTSESGELLPGAEFEIRNSSNQVIRTIATNSSGTAVIEGLDAGTYTVRETKAPTGYAVDVQLNKTVNVISGQNATVTFVNELLTGGLRIEKTSDSGELLQGAEFEVRNEAGTVVGSGTTNAQGILVVSDLVPGVYTVRETKAPSGYRVDVEAEKTVSIVGVNTASVSFVNELILGGLRIEKTNDSGEHLQGAVFEVRNAANEVVGTGTTNAQGVFVLNDLAPGAYTVRETTAPEGYAVDVEATKTVNVLGDQTASVTFVNELILGGLRIEKTNDSGEFLQGAEFEVRNAETNEVVGSGTTNASGVFVLEGLRPGNYIVQEVTAPEGYHIGVEAEQTVTVAGNGSVTARFVNTLIVGGLRIEKTDDSGEILPGAVFEVRDATTDEVVGTGTTNAQGVFEITGLVPGSYIVRETQAPTGYRVDTEAERTVNVLGEETTVVNFVNELILGGLRVEKTSETGEFLAGAIFEVRDEATGEVVGTGTTNSEGVFVLNGLRPGSYIVQETQAPMGYALDVEAEKVITVTGDQVASVSFVNELLTGNLRIEKMNNAGEFLQGAVFEVRRADTGEVVATGTSNAEGIFIVNDLIPGSYIVEETQAPDRYVVDVQSERTTSIIANETAVVTFVNELERGHIRIEKTGNSGELLAGAEFEVRDVNTGAVVASGTTNADGVYVANNLLPGSYEIRETKAPAGYVLDVTVNRTASVTGGQTANVSFVNELILGRLEIIKENERDTRLEGVEFTLYNQSDDTAVGTYVTDENGSIVINDLPIGVYVLVETQHLPGYVPNTQEYIVDFTNHDQTLPVVSRSVEVINVEEVFIGTSATDSQTRDHVSHNVSDITINDKVSYENLVIGKQYTVSGVLMNKATNSALLVNGEEVRSSLTFVAENVNGSVILPFTFDARALAGTEIVVFEKLYRDGIEVAAHEDINDENQTVRVIDPEIGTTATNQEDHSKELSPLQTVTIRDVVEYSGLVAGQQYTVSGYLMDKASNSQLLVDGAPVHASTSFVAHETSGTVEVIFTFNAVDLQGRELVVFEDLSYRNEVIARHHDINDEGQTVRVVNPEIGTKATNKEDGTQVSDALSEVTIVDEVIYTDLIVGKEYTVDGVLMVKSTNTPLLDNGEIVRATHTFIAPAKNGSVFLEFTFNASALQGESVVAFESLKQDRLEIAFHRDINDEEQTVRFRDPEIGTTATSQEDGGKLLDPLKEVTISDRVDYTDLSPGKEYTINGILMDKATNAPLLINGQEIRQTLTFVPEAENGFVVLNFTLNADGLHGKEVVVFEELFRGSDSLAIHHEIDDEGQTVEFTNPEIGTTATNKEDGSKVADPLNIITITDRVDYTGLLVGKEYTVSGVLMDKETNAPVLVNGEEVRSNLTFIAPSRDGFVNLDFTFNATGLRGKEIVVFEDLSREDTLLAIHHDINDEGQTVRITDPEIGTTATNKEDGSKLFDPLETVTLSDHVDYSDLIVGKEYTVNGVLMDKTTGEALLVNGEEVRSSVTFIAESTHGFVTVDFTFDAQSVRGKEIVVFEELVRADTVLTVHHDINDEGQTVRFTDPEIGTTATHKETGNKEVDPVIVTIQDEVQYEDLIVGKEYTMTGWLMVKGTNEALIQNGQRVEMTTTFIPEQSSGSIILDFVVDASSLRGETLVAFETLSRDGTTLAIHHDIEDEDQSVRVTDPEIGTQATVKEDGLKVADPLSEIVIQDEVSYTDLVVGQEYTINGWLMVKETNEPLIQNGQRIESTHTFIAESKNGSVFLDFVFDASLLRGQSLVVFESLHKDGFDIAIHHDIDDEGQTVRITNPEIGTEATHKETGNKEVDPVIVTIQDEVRYEDLIVGKEYTMTGWLMVKGTNEPLIQNGQRVEMTTTFIPEQSSGSIFLDFVVDASSLRGEVLVAFETLSREGETLAIHHDIEDEDQSVRVTDPEIGTTANVKEDGLKVADPLPEIVIQDEVAFTDLIVGQEYTISGWLMVKETNEPLIQNGERVTATHTFIAETKDGSVFLDFVLDASSLKGQSVVVFETLSKDDFDIAVHHDINDEGQTVRITHPEIGTKATHKETGNKEVDPVTVTIQDEVEYHDLIVGKEYTMTGWLMVKGTNEPLIQNGQRVEASHTFVAESTSGVLYLDFVVDASALRGETLVAFETLSREGFTIAIHHDIEDEDQSVRVTEPEIGTKATVKEDGLKVTDPMPEVVIQDEVTYSDLVIGQEYTINGWLMVKETNSPLVQNGKLVSASHTFIATQKEGSIFLDFTIDASLLRGQSIVAFETLSKDGVEIAVHHDINDEGQTVKINNPEVGTQAHVDGEKVVAAEGEVVITDIVSYTGLTPGKEYVLNGWLMRKSTEEPLLYDGEMITSTLTFIPETSDGEVTMEFVIPDASIIGNDSIVVFEELSRDGVIIAEHKDINDEGQTITFYVPEKPEEPGRPSLPPTGEARSTNYMNIVFIMLALMGIVLVKRNQLSAK